MRVLVVYSGKTGFTERYAGWIAEELNGKLLSYKDFAKEKLDADDVVIFGGRIHVGRVESLQKILEQFSGKENLIVFGVGATPAEEEEAVETIWKNSLGDSIDIIPHFYMQGGLNYEKMGFLDRKIMKMVAKAMSTEKNKTDTQAGFSNAITSSHDISSREYIKPLIDLVKEKYGI